MDVTLTDALIAASAALGVGLMGFINARRADNTAKKATDTDEKFRMMDLRMDYQERVLRAELQRETERADRLQAELDELRSRKK